MNVVFKIFSAKSPVFTHITSTLYGIPTIRAAKAEKMLQNEFDSHQDLNSGTFFMFLGKYNYTVCSIDSNSFNELFTGTSYGFGTSLDLMIYVFIACVIYTYLLIDFGLYLLFTIFQIQVNLEEIISKVQLEIVLD